MSDRRTLIIIPAFNEEAALPGVLKDLATHAPECDVLVVDDGSQDDTFRVAAEAGASVARLPFNLGVGGALRTGFRYAVERGYRRAVQFDADGQHQAIDIAKLLDGLDSGLDLVIGSRFTSDDASYRVGAVRGGGMYLLRALLRVLAAQKFSDPSSGFRAFSGPMFGYFARTCPVEYLGDTVEALLLAVYDGFEVGEISVLMRQRQEGQPSNRNLMLTYHFMRLLLVMVFTASRRGRHRDGAGREVGTHWDPERTSS
jgi:glycosyltransferase involved in cell wall biosynthesis